MQGFADEKEEDFGRKREVRCSSSATAQNGPDTRQTNQKSQEAES
jgi:hypothetical protein